MRRAAERADGSQLRELEKKLETARRATLSGRPDRVSRANAAFHHHIVELADNELLSSTTASLEGRLRWLFQQIDDPGPLWDEHRELYDAIAAGAVDAVGELSPRHVRHYREVALQLLFGERGGNRPNGG